MEWRFEAPFQWLFRKANHIIGISDRIREEYNKRTGLKLLFIPPLIPFTLSKKSKNDSREELGITPGSKVVLMVGSLKSLKHPETAIDTFSIFGQEYLNREKLLLVFAGDGPDRKQLERKLVDLGLERHVTFLGNVPREEIMHIYCMADMYIMASDFEGTPLSMLEAMANGLPVMGSNAPGINTIIEHEFNGMLFSVGDEKQLAVCIERLLSNADLRQKLVLNAQDTIKSRYDHDKMITHYRKLWGI